jgi:hypothetical protein
MKTVKKMLPYALAGFLAMGAATHASADDVSLGLGIGEANASVNISVIATLLSLLRPTSP